MLKQNWRLVSRVQRIGDLLLIVLCFFAAYYGRASLLFWNETFNLSLPFEGQQLAPLKDYFFVLFVALTAYGLVLEMLGAYSSMRLLTSWQLLKITVFGSGLVFLLLSALLFLTKIDLSRSFIALFCLLNAIFLLAMRFFVMELLRFWRRRGRNFRTILVCGTGPQAEKFASEIRKAPELGIRVLGFVDLSSAARGAVPSVAGHIFRGREEFLRALKNHAIDEVVFTDVIQVMPEVEEFVLLCSEQGIRTTLIADLFSVGIVKSGISYFRGLPLIHFQTPPGDRWELAVKRTIDIAVAASMIALLSPLGLLIAIGVKLSSPGPILFRQRRVGLNGRTFFLFKFRSMYKDSEKRLAELREFNEMSGPTFKMKDDPRITPLGRFLRRYSLDELPQLWNVLLGEMSLVGPRPPIPGEVSMYERRDRRRLSMRPGITCSWQVSGRSNIQSFEEWVRLDLEYIDNWSLKKDLALLFKTVPAVIFASGAR